MSEANKTLKPGDLHSTKYHLSPSYQEYNAGGVWGGPLPDGSFQMFFYEEHMAPPVEAIRKVVGSGSNALTLEVKEEPSDVSIARSVKCSVVVPASFIPKLITWLKTNEQPGTKEEKQ